MKDKHSFVLNTNIVSPSDIPFLSLILTLSPECPQSSMTSRQIGGLIKMDLTPSLPLYRLKTVLFFSVSFGINLHSGLYFSTVCLLSFSVEFTQLIRLEKGKNSARIWYSFNLCFYAQLSSKTYKHLHDMNFRDNSILNQYLIKSFLL